MKAEDKTLVNNHCTHIWLKTSKTVQNSVEFGVLYSFVQTSKPYCTVRYKSRQFCTEPWSSVQNCEVLSSSVQNCKVLSSFVQNCEILSSSVQNCEALSSSVQNREVLSSSVQNCKVLSSSLEYREFEIHNQVETDFPCDRSYITIHNTIYHIIHTIHAGHIHAGNIHAGHTPVQSPWAFDHSLRQYLKRFPTVLNTYSNQPNVRKWCRPQIEET